MGAAEECDRTDNNCDRVIDEGCPEDCSNLIDDNGNSDADCDDEACLEEEHCLEPQMQDRDDDGFRGIEGDCDDDDPDASPGLMEDPTNGWDDDCDGLVDERMTVTAEAAVKDAGPVAGRTLVEDSFGRLHALLYDRGTGEQNQDSYVLFTDLAAGGTRVPLPEETDGACALAPDDAGRIWVACGGELSTELGLTVWRYDPTAAAWDAAETIDDGTWGETVYAVDVVVVDDVPIVAWCDGGGSGMVAWNEDGAWERSNGLVSCSADIVLLYDANERLVVAGAGSGDAAYAAVGSHTGTWGFVTGTLLGRAEVVDGSVDPTTGEAVIYGRYRYNDVVWTYSGSWVETSLSTGLAATYYQPAFVVNAAGEPCIFQADTTINLVGACDGIGGTLEALGGPSVVVAARRSDGTVALVYTDQGDAETRLGIYDGGLAQSDIASTSTTAGVAATDREGTILLLWLEESAVSTGINALWSSWNGSSELIYSAALGLGGDALAVAGNGTVYGGLYQGVTGSLATTWSLAMLEGGPGGWSFDPNIVGLDSNCGYQLPVETRLRADGTRVFASVSQSRACSWVGDSRSYVHVLEADPLTWEIVATLVADTTVGGELVITSDETAYLAWASNGVVYLYQDAGYGWSAWLTLTGSQVHDLEVDPTDDSLLLLYDDGETLLARVSATSTVAVGTGVTVLTGGELLVDTHAAAWVSGATADGAVYAWSGTPETGLDPEDLPLDRLDGASWVESGGTVHLLADDGDGIWHFSW